MILSINYLEKLRESEEIGNVLQEIIDIFLAAINDWPNPILDLNDYEKQISVFIDSDIKSSKLKDYLSKIDHSKYAWQSESLIQILDVFKYYEDGKSLKEILNDLNEKIIIKVK